MNIRFVDIAVIDAGHSLLFGIGPTFVFPWSCGFDLHGRPGSIMLYPSEQNKSRMTIALMYELPTIRNDSLLEPKEDFDVVGPGEIFRAISKPTEKVINKQ